MTGEPPHCHHIDDALLVVEKPAGLLSVPGRGPDKSDCLASRVQRHWPGALVVHRLDMATSGLILFARDAATQRALGDAFAERRTDKRYEAVVAGLPPAFSGDWQTIDLPIAADWARRPLRVVDAAGKPSITRWRLLSHDAAAGTSRLALAPVTGRTHQLRVHLAATGHPIVGDALYADGAVLAASPRLLLHACALGLVHPATGARMAFASPTPF